MPAYAPAITPTLKLSGDIFMANTPRNVSTSVPSPAGLPTTPPDLDAFDSKAILSRVEFAIDVLRNRYICKGWNENFDHAAADRTLSYFKQVTEHGEPDDDDEAMQAEWEAALDFFASHGVSLDWIIAGDMGSLISKAAAHSSRARALPVSA